MGPTSTLFRKKKTLKLGFTVLFTHLKIILLQCFQFSIFNKISGIQTNPYFVSNGSSFLSIKKETGSSPILSCFGVLHPKKDCLPTMKVKNIDNVASPWFLFASCEIATTLEIKFLYSLSFVRFFFVFLVVYSIFGFFENTSILLAQYRIPEPFGPLTSALWYNP